MQGFGSSITSTASHAAWSTPVRPDGIAVAHTTRLTEGGGGRASGNRPPEIDFLQMRNTRGHYRRG